jgi:hypothetical protein
MPQRSYGTVEHKEHLKGLRHACDDVSAQLASSREAIEKSYALLRLAGKIEAVLIGGGGPVGRPKTDR